MIGLSGWMIMVIVVSSAGVVISTGAFVGFSTEFSSDELAPSRSNSSGTTIVTTFGVNFAGVPMVGKDS